MTGRSIGGAERADVDGNDGGVQRRNPGQGAGRHACVHVAVHRPKTGTGQIAESGSHQVARRRILAVRPRNIGGEPLCRAVRVNGAVCEINSPRSPISRRRKFSGPVRTTASPGGSLGSLEILRRRAAPILPRARPAGLLPEQSENWVASRAPSGVHRHGSTVVTNSGTSPRK